MNRRKFPRAAAFPLLGAALLSACADRVPTDPAAAPPAVALTVVPTTAFATIEGGENHGCALTSGGQGWCWGRNSYGQVGDGSAATPTTPVQVTHPSGVTFSELGVGRYHTCALSSGGAAYCWGSNADGRLGDGTTTLPLVPVAVQGGLTFTSIDAGEHTCALDSSGDAYCWGGNNYGQLGDNTTTFRNAPTAVQMPSGVSFTQIVAGDVATCALDTSNQAWCWGYGGDGTLGYGFSLGDSVPQQVTHPSGVTFTSISLQSKSTCALSSAGQAYCWGKNNGGQLGDNTTTTRYTPVTVQQPSGVTFASLTTGDMHTCARTSAGAGYCWGAGSRGQIGEGNWVQRKTPVAVSMPSGVTFSQVSNMFATSCALDSIGQTWCWGRGDYYQIGNNSTSDVNVPTAVSH